MGYLRCSVLLDLVKALCHVIGFLRYVDEVWLISKLKIE